MADDDFAAFLAEIKETKPAEEAGPGAADTTAGAATAEAGAGVPSPPGKRPREEVEEEEYDAGAAAEGGGQSAAAATISAAAPPVVKKAKMVVAKAKPQIFTPQAQEAAAEAAKAAAAAVTAQIAASAQGNAGAGGAAAGGDYGGGGGGGGGYPGADYMQHQQHQQPAAGGYMAGAAAGMGVGAVGMPGAVPGAAGTKKPKKFVRVGASTEETWEDPTLNEWPDNDFRLFCGDLGNEVNEEILANAFRTKYPSFAKAKIIREKHTGKSKGYGFVSFLDPFEGLKALREMNLKYIGSRPVKLRKSDWKDRNLGQVKKKEKEKKKFLHKLGLA